MGFDIALGAGETAAGVVEAESAHVDELVQAEFLGGDVLRRNECRRVDDAFAQGGQARRRAADGDHGEVAVGIEAAFFQDETDDAVFLRADGGDADLFAFKISNGFDIRCREDPPVERIDAASEIDRVGPADGRGDDGRATDEAQRHLAGDHCRREYRAALDVDQVDVETVFSEQPGLAHDVDDAQGGYRRGIADDELFQFWRVGWPSDPWKNNCKYQRNPSNDSQIIPPSRNCLVRRNYPLSDADVKSCAGFSN